LPAEKSAPCWVPSDVDNLIGQLHGGDDIQHVGCLTDFLFLQNDEMIKAGDWTPNPEGAHGFVEIPTYAYAGRYSLYGNHRAGSI